MSRGAEPIWRAITVYRLASLALAALLVFLNRHHYDRFGWAWVVLGAMAAWTVATSFAYKRETHRIAWLLTADLLVTAGLLLSTELLQDSLSIRHGTMPVTATWVAGPVLAVAARYGRLAGGAAALFMGGTDVLLRSGNITIGFNGAVQLVLAGVLTGHLARLYAQVENERQRVIQVEAASQERERLARHIHDGVLQVLALVQRRGADAGGEAAELGRLAGQQEAALRALIGTGPAGIGTALAGDAGADLRGLLRPFGAEKVTVSVPATAVMMRREAAEELASAVRAALDNVRQHCGDQAKAWLLVEDEPDIVTVTIRDDGPGIAAGRLAEAAATGRLGVSHSIRGRLRDLGGSARIRSSPGEGTEVELKVPR